jgi:uncharacterized membrane protein
MTGKSNVRKIVVAGALGALTIALDLTPFGYIPWFGGASITVMCVPVIIGAVLEGPIVGTVIGAIFGATALVTAATAPKGPIDVFFVNPLISILPRLLVGLAAWAVYKAFRGKFLPLASALAGIAGSLTNSIFVLGALVVFGAIPLAVAGTVFIANGLIEATVAAILTVAVVAAWKGIESRSGRAKLAKEE